MKIKKILTILILFLSILTLIAKKVSARLYLNEIYPVPVSGEKEWVEIYNDVNQEVNLTHYTLTDSVGNKINFESSIITANGFSLGVSTNVLNNTGDTVYLKNDLDGIIEVATYSGSFSSDKTFAKCPNGIGSWYTLRTITKNLSNETACLALTPSPTVTPTPIPSITPTPILTPTQSPTPTPQPSPTPTSTSEVKEPTPTTQIPTITNSPIPSPILYEGIFISEVMVNPESGEKEWVEIYNNNDFAVSINNWYIDDFENAGSAPKNISLDIGSKGYYVYELTSSIFNNDGDQIRLLDFNKNLKDSFEYSSSTQGQTWGRTAFENDNFCLQEPSKGLTNNSCSNPTSEPTEEAQPTTKPLLMANGKWLITQKPNSQSRFSQNTERSINNLPLSLTINHYPLLTIHPSPEILGTNIEQKLMTKSSAPAKGLSFISFSYSLLTIASVLIKMKVNA